MNEQHIHQIANELGIGVRQVAATAKLFEDGATVPFIARYRKEATQSLDEVAITSIRNRLEQLAELDKRRQTILKSLDERSMLTDELKESIMGAETMSALEDIYQPYRPKRRTKATIAREQGLEPLADRLFEGQTSGIDPEAEAAAYVDAEKGVESVEQALTGARHILAERMSEDAEARARMRNLYAEKGVVSSKVVSGKEDAGAKFKDYFEWQEPIAKIPSHRLLAIRRGEAEEVLIVRIKPPEEEAVALLEQQFVAGRGAAGEQVRMAAHDAYKRLLGPAMEGETRLESKKQADHEAIRVFSDNLRELLLAAPLGQRPVLAIDPGFRTGCKVVCLDRQGKLLEHDVIYPDQRAVEAAKKIRSLCEQFSIEAIAIGNGTASRETEAFVRKLGLPSSITVVMVNESGASVYSASEVARKELPDHDVTVRGAVSIGRRLMDPLAELVKLDPKSIGVGQYQHDVDQSSLKKGLDDVVVSCVNAVGVEVNTASEELLSYVSGVGPQVAKNIIAYRNEHGPFRSRNELKKVSRLGPKVFEQAGGFLRIRDANHPLDASAVHPESYSIVETMAGDLGASVSDLMKDKALRNRIELKCYISDAVGMPTLNDILAELAKPGRDPRAQFEAVQFKEGIEKVEDLAPGMKLPGVVTNVTAFGAFVDVGVHQDGLVHISQLADRYVKDPGEVVKVHQSVQVTVVEVDLPRRRIALSMRTNPEIGGTSTKPKTDRASQESRKPKQRSSASMTSDLFSQAFDNARQRKG